MSSKVSVIVITYNGKHHLYECLSSLQKQRYKNFKTYLLDNASTDGSSEYVAENFPWVKIIRLDKNYGFAEGYNKAIEQVKSEYVVLLNDDTKVDKNWLKNLVNTIEVDNEIFAVGSKIYFYYSPQIIQHAGIKITLIGSGIDIGFGESDRSEYNRKKYVGALCGASLIIRRRLFMKLGGFDNKYFSYLEDVDLCWRAWMYGYKVVYTPNSIVYHKYGGTWGKRLTPHRIFHSQKNRLMNILKNFELKNAITGIFLSIIFDLIRIFLFLKNKSIESIVNILAIINGNIYFLKNLPYVLMKRRDIQRKRKISDKVLISLGLISPLLESIHEFIKLDLVRKSRNK